MRKGPGNTQEENIHSLHGTARMGCLGDHNRIQLGSHIDMKVSLSRSFVSRIVVRNQAVRQFQENKTKQTTQKKPKQTKANQTHSFKSPCNKTKQETKQNKTRNNKKGLNLKSKMQGWKYTMRYPLWKKYGSFRDSSVLL